MPKDPRFATESSNSAFTNYEGTVVDAFFAPGTFGAQLNLVVQLAHPELHPLIQGGTQTVRLGVGGKWDAGDGQTLVHPDGPKADGSPRAIGQGTEYGVLLKKQIEEDGLVNIDGFMASIGSDWDPRVAKSWKGLTFRFDEVEYETRTVLKDAAGNDEVDDNGKVKWGPSTKSRVMPVEFIGVKGSPSSNGQLDPINVETLALSDDLKAAVAKSLDAPDYKTFLSAFKGDEFGAVFTAVPNKETYAALQAGTAETF